jgi:hypothetical protein
MVTEQLTDEQRHTLIFAILNGLPKVFGTKTFMEHVELVSMLTGTDTIVSVTRAYPSLAAKKPDSQHDSP